MNTRKNWSDSFYNNNSNNINNSYYTREETISDVQENFNIRRYNSAEGYEVECENVRDWVLIQSHTNPLNEKKEDKKMHFPLTFNIQRGSIINWLKYNENWLAISKVDIVGDAYKSVQIDKCNNTLKWIDSYGNIQQTPCILSTLTISTDGLDEGNTLTLLDTKKSLMVSNNNLTKDLKEGQRLLFNHNKRYCYEISEINELTNVGLINITLISSAFYSSTDDLENNLCNINNLAVYEMRILSTNPLSISTGNTVNLQVELLNNGVLVTDNSMLSQIIYNSDNENVATIDNNGLITGVSVGSCNISARYGGIVDSIGVNVVSEVVADSITYDLTPTLSMGYVIKKSNTNTFTAHKYNNGVEVATTFDFDINLNGLNSSSVSIVETTSNYAKIKNISVDTSSPYKTIFVLYREIGQIEWLSKEIILKGIYG